MSSRLVSIAALAAAASLCMGCPGDGAKPGTTGAAPTTAKPSTAAPAATGTGKAAAATAEKFGKGIIAATVKFSGEAPPMKVPKKRKDAELCKDKEVKYNAVLVKDGKLQDVYVGIAAGQLKGEYEADKPATVNQQDCMYSPRLQGILVGQALVVKNSDATLHNVNAGIGTKTLFNTAQPKGAPDLKKEDFEEPGIYRFKCDVHSWMRAFVIASDNPFHAVTGEDGSAKIEKVPDGKYTVWAWHSQYGKKEKTIEVKGGEVKVEFEFDGTEDEPAENKGELKDLF